MLSGYLEGESSVPSDMDKWERGRRGGVDTPAPQQFECCIVLFQVCIRPQSHVYEHAHAHMCIV